MSDSLASCEARRNGHHIRRRGSGGQRWWRTSTPRPPIAGLPTGTHVWRRRHQCRRDGLASRRARRNGRHVRRRCSGGRRWRGTATMRPPITRPPTRTHAWGQRPGTRWRKWTGRRRRRTGWRRRTRRQRRRRRTPWGNAEGAAWGRGSRHLGHHRGHGHGRRGCHSAGLRRLASPQPPLSDEERVLPT